MSSSLDVRTLYIRNLNEKVSKNTLQRELLNKFKEISMQDKIVNVSIFKNLQLRGQAFVTCATREDCDKIIDLLNTDILLNKPMDIYLANSNCDVVMQGISNMEIDDDKSRANLSKIRFQNRMEKLSKNKNLSKKRLLVLDNHNNNANNYDNGTVGDPNQNDAQMDIDEAPAPKKIKLVENEEPSNILLLQGLPIDMTSDEIAEIFESYTGFTDVNYVAIRKVAFIEFDNLSNATKCFDKLGKIINIKSKECLLTYAKK